MRKCKISKFNYSRLESLEIKIRISKIKYYTGLKKLQISNLKIQIYMRIESLKIQINVEFPKSQSKDSIRRLHFWRV